MTPAKSSLLSLRQDVWEQHVRCRWGFDFDFPFGFGRTSYVRPPRHTKGVYAAHDRLLYWAGRAVRFRDRPGRTAPRERAMTPMPAGPGRLPLPPSAG